MPATSTIRPTRVFVLQVSAAAKSVCGGRLYAYEQIFAVRHAEKLFKSDSNCQSYSKYYRGILF